MEAWIILTTLYVLGILALIDAKYSRILSISVTGLSAAVALLLWGGLLYHAGLPRGVVEELKLKPAPSTLDFTVQNEKRAYYWTRNELVILKLPQMQIIKKLPHSTPSKLINDVTWNGRTLLFTFNLRDSDYGWAAIKDDKWLRAPGKFEKNNSRFPIFSYVDGQKKIHLGYRDFQTHSPSYLTTLQLEENTGRLIKETLLRTPVKSFSVTDVCRSKGKLYITRISDHRFYGLNTNDAAPHKPQPCPGHSRFSFYQPDKILLPPFLKKIKGNLLSGHLYFLGATSFERRRLFYGKSGDYYFPIGKNYLKVHAPEKSVPVFGFKYMKLSLLTPDGKTLASTAIRNFEQLGRPLTSSGQIILHNSGYKNNILRLNAKTLERLNTPSLFQELDLTLLRSYKRSYFLRIPLRLLLGYSLLFIFCIPLIWFFRPRKEGVLQKLCLLHLLVALPVLIYCIKTIT